MTHVTVPFDDDSQASLFSYWDKTRGQNLLPTAADIDPSQIISLLREIAILDVFSASDIRYRLAGTGITERLGSDPTGENLLDITSPDSKDLVSNLLHTVITHPVGAIAHYQNTYSTGRLAPVRSMFLPVAANQDGNPRIISIHTRDAATAYEAEQATTTVATTVEDITWIDLGAGTPETA